MYNLFPFDNDIALCSITGRNLRNTQFITGTNSNYYINWSDYGESIRYSINDSTTYYLVTDTYTVDYYTSLNVVSYLENGGTYARDLLDRYIRNDGFGTRPQPQQGHEGTLSDPRTVQEALEYAYTHPGSSASAAGSLAMYYKGVVSRQAISVSDYGDMYKVYIADAGTNYEIMIYYLKRTQGGSTKWQSVDDLQIGDELIVHGRAFYYNSNTPELDNTTYVYSINGVPTA